MGASWIGGEELHNNHHAYPTSAKFSIKRYEFDIGWLYIRALETLGLAKVRKIPPQLKLGAIKPVADNKTLEAIIANRYEVMANFARSLRHASRAELERAEERGRRLRTARADADRASLAAPRRRQDPDRGQGARRRRLGVEPYLAKLVAMREELRLLWTRTGVSAEQLVADLQAWLKKAEESGIAALQEFALRLRAAHA